MAKMLPKLKENEIDRRINYAGERVVYRALRDQLPDDWVVRHSYFSCRRYDNGQRLNAREVDFIVLAPGRGVLFLEVKDSFGYECRDARWFRIKRDGREEEMEESPFWQVNSAKHHLIEVFSRDQGINKDHFPGIYGHVVIYPFGRREGAMPRSHDPAIVVMKQDMGKLYHRLEAAFDDWGSRQVGERFRGVAFDWMHEAMKDECQFVTVGSTTSAADNAAIEKLTRQQFETFRGLLTNRRALVDGRAGSGKTLLGLWAANAIASFPEKPRVLFLCFSRLLPAWLRAKYPPLPGVAIESYHAMALRYISQAGFKVSISPNQEEFFNRTAPELFEKAIDLIGDTGLYDAIIVDEAHDFAPSWWLSTEMLLRDERTSKFFILYDPDQLGVFANLPQANVGPDRNRDASLESWLPIRFDTKFTLEKNCRNTEAIAQFGGNVLGKSIDVRGDAPKGKRPDVRAAKSDPSARASEVEAVVMRWIEKEQFTPSQIAILSPFRRDNPANCLQTRTHVAGIKLLGSEEHLNEWLDGKGILCVTTKAFKGLEAECVVVADVPDVPTPGMSLHEMYVGATRAKHHLCLLPLNDSAHAKLRRW
jgi:hypothetical protein